MTRILLPLTVAFALMGAPAVAQDDTQSGFLERGLAAIIGQLTGSREGEPPLAQELSQAFRQMGPVLQDLAAQVDDIRNYQAPERLPNGDILIRRRPDASPPPPLGKSLLPDEDDAPPEIPKADGPIIEL